MSENNKAKAVFLDRDDTIVDDPGYITKPDQLKLLPGVGDALRRLRLLGYKLVIITNQSAVARGMITEESLQKIHDKLLGMLSNEGIKIEKIYHCPFHPEGIIEDYKKDSDMRKPAPGMLFAARDELNIDLSESWMIGDSYRDIAAGKAAGCSTILINSPTNPRIRKIDDPKPDHIAVNIKEAANIIKMMQRKEKQTQSSDTESSEPKLFRNNQQRMSDDAIRMLKEIRQAILSMRTSRQSAHFSLFKAASGIAQAITLLCVLIAVIKLFATQPQDLSTLKPLAFAGVFQLMAIMFYIVDNDNG